MDLAHLRDFMALSEHRSFSAAARERHVTQPAFSKRIRSLEEDLGVHLIDRTTTPVTLTPAGIHLAAAAHDLLDNHDRLLANMRAMATRIPRALHIQMSNSLSSAFFPDWYRHMQRRVKGLTFRLSRQRSHLQLDDLRAGRADFSVQIVVRNLPRHYNYTGTKQQVIGHDRLLLVRAPRLPKSSRALLTNWPDSYLVDCLERMLGAEWRKRMKVVFECQGTEMLRGMTLAGFGAALLPEGLIADDLKDGYLVPADPGLRPLITDITLIRADRPLPPLAEAVWKKAASDRSA